LHSPAGEAQESCRRLPGSEHYPHLCRFPGPALHFGLLPPNPKHSLPLPSKDSPAPKSLLRAGQLNAGGPRLPAQSCQQGPGSCGPLHGLERCPRLCHFPALVESLPQWEVAPTSTPRHPQQTPARPWADNIGLHSTARMWVDSHGIACTPACIWADTTASFHVDQ
jgi:hypothetical protein